MDSLPQDELALIEAARRASMPAVALRAASAAIGLVNTMNTNPDTRKAYFDALLNQFGSVD